MSNIRKAVYHSSLGRYVTMIIGLASTMVIARLLTPSEIGTFAIASSIVMIMSEFRILGANTYIIRETSIDESKIRSAYGLTILVSWGLGLIVFLTALPLSNYFNIDSVYYIFIILSLSFLVAPYISIPDALLSREYNFKAINLTKIIAAAAQLVLTICLIYLGFSYYSLALGYLFNIAIRAILMLYLSRHHRVYKPVFRGLKPIVKLGLYTSVSNVVKRAQHTTPDMVIGKLGKTDEVGFFSRGLGFIVFVWDVILSGILPIALPYLSDVKKRGESVAEAYIKATQLITGLVWPVFVVASVASLPAIRLMFGDQWDEAAPIASVAAFWAIFRAGHAVLPEALLASGEEGTLMLKELFIFGIFIVSIVYGYLESSLLGLSYAFVFSSVCDFLLSILVAKRKLQMNVYLYFKSLVSSFLVMILCWLSIYSISIFYQFEDTSPIFILLLIIIFMPITWLISIFLFRHPLRMEISGMIRRFF